MRYEQTMQVKASYGNLIEQACRVPLADCARDEILFDLEVVFVNDNRMAVQVIASGNAEETAWTQGVVFSDVGEELGCTDVGESFAGEYHVAAADGNEYVCNVVLVQGM
jgi:hypothetical protein